jgi:hypothetical protein
MRQDLLHLFRPQDGLPLKAGGALLSLIFMWQHPPTEKILYCSR